MSDLLLRKKVHDFVDKADERLLKMVFALMSEYDDYRYEFTVSERKEIYKRSSELKSGKVKSKSVSEITGNARKRLKK